MSQAHYPSEVPDIEPELTALPAPRRGEDEFNADVDARLGSHLKAAHQALMAAKSEALRDFGLTVAQFAALIALYYVPGQSSAQLARAAAVTPQTMAQILGRLEQKQLITRVPSKLHSKVLVTNLTAAGEALALEADVETRRIEQRLTSALSESERDLLRTLLGRIVQELRGTE